MRRRDRPLDIFKKLHIVSSLEEIILEDDNGSIIKSVDPETLAVV